MALRIKSGVEIYAYGKGCKAFTSESELSQEILEHLKSRFPDDIEDGGKSKPVKTEEELQAEAEAAEKKALKEAEAAEKKALKEAEAKAKADAKATKK
jgi:membrane protein involved in colicin uptake